MPRKILISFLLLMSISAVYAQAIFHVTQTDVDSALVALDIAITHKEEYQSKRFKHIKQEESRLKGATQAEQQKILKELIDNNMNFRSKQVLHWLELLRNYPEYKEGSELYYWALCREAQVYATMGMTHRAHSILYQLNRYTVNKELQSFHDDIVLKAYNWEMATFNFTTPLTPKEEEERQRLIKSQQENIKDSTDLIFLKVTQEMKGNHSKEIKELLRPIYDKMQGQNIAYFYAAMAQAYLGAKDTLAATYALAMTSIEDIQLANADYMCLPVLVDILFKKGDIERSHRYLLCCMDDAHLYPAYFLSGEINSIFPIINKEYQLTLQEKNESDAKIKMLVIIIGFLSLCAMFALIYARYRRLMMDKLRKQNKELEKSNEIKSGFIKSMTHELHTPLNAISGLAQVLSTNDAAADSKMVKDLAASIEISTHDLTKQLDNIILLSTIDATYKGRITKSEFKISDLLNSITTEMDIYKHHTISFSIENNTSSDATITTNKTLLKHAIMTTIDNAMKFTTIGSVVLAVTKEESNYLFTVTDTGCGIPKGEEERVFERFVKLGEFNPGIGIGLSLCRDIMSDLGGKVYIDKDYKEQGTRVVISI